jgi:hypothetical protein
MGWADLDNGALLRAAAAAGFDLLITCDRNIYHQQSLRLQAVGVVVLPTNRWSVLRGRVDVIAEAVERASSGEFVVIPPFEAE